ncbi:MAG: DUF5925 domain-containing protein, partial [Actinomycetota bacterium]|nr:DUF5925 domain-containing protein [Actinomycetota bacterium]
MGTNDNNTRADLQLTPGGVRRTPHDFRTDALPRALFVAEVVAHGLSHMTQDSFRGLTPPAKLSELASAVLVRADHEADEVEAFLRLPGGELALVDTGHGHVRIEVASDTRQAANTAAKTLRAALETGPPVADRVSVAFWMRGEWGGDVRHRDIDCERFDEIAENYAAPVRDALQRLIDARAHPRAGHANAAPYHHPTSPSSGCTRQRAAQDAAWPTSSSPRCRWP